MGRVLVMLLLAICCIRAVPDHYQRLDGDICNHDDIAFLDGETLVYKLYYNFSLLWIPAGEVTFHLSETDSTYEAMIEGRSYGSYDNFFRVRDQFRSTIDKSAMKPLSFVRRVEEGNHRRFDSLTFDYERELIYSLNGDSIQSAVWDTFELKECTQDLVSIMYNLRNLDIDNYKPGDQINGDIFFDEEYSPITIDYLKKEKKKVKNLGKHEAVKIRPKVIIGSVFKEDDVMNIWVSADKNRIPLQIESPIRIGTVKAVLLSYNGLKYDLK